jgi:hypothetical protein
VGANDFCGVFCGFVGNGEDDDFAPFGGVSDGLFWVSVSVFDLVSCGVKPVPIAVPTLPFPIIPIFTVKTSESEFVGILLNLL